MKKIAYLIGTQLFAIVLFTTVPIAVAGRAHPVAAEQRQQSIPAGEVLDGRLGGTFLSFQARFGPGDPATGSFGMVFTTPNLGIVKIQFDRTGSAAKPEDPALIVTFGPDRDPSRPASEPDPADWPFEDAVRRAGLLLPEDVRVDSFEEQSANSQTAVCHSSSLEEQFGVLSLGQCRIVLITPTPETVSYVTLSLTGGLEAIESGTPGAGGACEGFESWAKSTGIRLDKAASLLSELSNLTESSPETDSSLREIAAGFAELADDQRADSTPAALAKANYFLIRGFASYIDAITSARQGLASGDTATIEQATGMLADARTNLSRGNVEIEAAAKACGLVIATPVA